MKQDVIKLRASRPIRSAGGWKRSLHHYNNGVVCYCIAKDGHQFFIRDKRECDWFCRIFSGSITEGLYKAIENHYQRYSFQTVVSRSIVL